MTTTTFETYGLGGYDPTKPNNNILKTVEVKGEALDAAPEASQATQIAELYALVSDLYQQTGADTQALESSMLSLVSERTAPVEQAVRARVDTSAPRTRYQWVGGADGDLVQVEDTETKPVERIEPDDA